MLGRMDSAELSGKRIPRLSALQHGGQAQDTGFAQPRVPRASLGQSGMVRGRGSEREQRAKTEGGPPKLDLVSWVGRSPILASRN